MRGTVFSYLGLGCSDERDSYSVYTTNSIDD